MIQIAPELLAAPLEQQPTEAAEGLAVPLQLTIGTVHTFKRQYDEVREQTHTNTGKSAILVVLEGSVAYQTREEKKDLPQGAIHAAPLLTPYRLIATSEGGAVVLNILVPKFDVQKTQEHIAAAGKHLEALTEQLAVAAEHVRAATPEKKGFWK